MSIKPVGARLIAKVIEEEAPKTSMVGIELEDSDILKGKVLESNFEEEVPKDSTIYFKKESGTVIEDTTVLDFEDILAIES